MANLYEFVWGVIDLIYEWKGLVEKKGLLGGAPLFYNCFGGVSKTKHQRRSIEFMGFVGKEALIGSSFQ